MNELQNKYIRNQILSVPMKLNQELTHKDKKFNKRSDYDNIIKYIDKLRINIYNQHIKFRMEIVWRK